MNDHRHLRLLSMLLMGALIIFAIVALVPENGDDPATTPTPGGIAVSKTALSQP